MIDDDYGAIPPEPTLAERVAALEQMAAATEKLGKAFDKLGAAFDDLVTRFSGARPCNGCGLLADDHKHWLVEGGYQLLCPMCFDNPRARM